MGSISLNVSGGNPPFDVQVREISEMSGNRCVGCTGISNLSNLNVNFIADGVEHTYVATVTNADGCHPGITQFSIICACAALPTVVVTSSCLPSPHITVTPNVAGGGQLRVKVENGGTLIYNQLVNSGSTVSIEGVINGQTYEVYAEIPSASSCKSGVQNITINCEEEGCTISATASNPIC